MTGLALRPCRGSKAFPECGALIPANAPGRRCDRCRRATAADKNARNRATGRDRRDVRRVMAAVTAKAGTCSRCGGTRAEVGRLTAHLVDAAAVDSVHTPTSVYRALCESCHRTVEREERGTPRG